MENQVKLDVNLETKIREFLRVGKKVEAIAAVQNQMNLGLRNSKDIVDEVEESMNVSHFKKHDGKINL